MRTPTFEREVCITFYTDADTANVYSSDYSYMSKLDKLCAANPTEWKQIDEAYCGGDIVSKTYSCPKQFISFRSKARSTVQTEEKKEAMRERMRLVNESRRSRDAF